MKDLSQMTIEELLATQEEIEEQLAQRYSIPDGFFYIGLIAQHLTYRREQYANRAAAINAEDKSDCGDSYLIRIYTNNPKAKEFIFVKSLDQVPEQYGIIIKKIVP